MEAAMNDMNTIFRKLLGREPNDDEIQEILRVKDVLGLSRDDSLWGVRFLGLTSEHGVFIP
jgi:hypothetical protein